MALPSLAPMEAPAATPNANPAVRPAAPPSEPPKATPPRQNSQRPPSRRIRWHWHADTLSRATEPPATEPRACPTQNAAQAAYEYCTNKSASDSSRLTE
eukprot:CAMPEP_0115640402 /NCGR_PEP_ID=MMETSP0272-20121206/35768_1 /TAXON_ID=71861 /ORGANISM="Scrippsiella trochoidea, Strain CCMP3099" /LENGTH=98 /DNA_ID=CAMNT_0003077641 /DNA_START=349 /DNA_END=645 /DNA_ORIENTATION=-